MRDRPFDEVKADMNDGKSVLSVAYNLIRQMQAEASADDLSAEQDTIARNVAGVAYAGAADTTTAAAESFVLAMAMYPDVQKRAQAELDAIVGPSRLPGFSDLDSLTYVRAVVMENLRWMPTVPLGIPHRLIEDDEYNGNHIPKGAIITPNVWAMMHNSDDYPEPETFKPERFIGSDGNINSAIRDPRTIAFGFGRRACPGSDFAISLLSICVASMLHVFDIQAGIDDHGQPVILSSETGGDAIASPLTFPRRMRSRSIQAERLIRDAALDAEEVDLL
ncbi:hypothetical protein EUX98_g2923 [Antrodiella citrinella]|uniref:Cytochrome P450 n=1 Tax=Antrodiella citrinella TaxID=2447956 RepID=A0A4S4MZ52_9APHY|nr:hypothetical protein EUX98_g2923 [Antrodiella citrinella]